MRKFFKGKSVLKTIKNSQLLSVLLVMIWAFIGVAQLSTGVAQAQNNNDDRRKEKELKKNQFIFYNGISNHKIDVEAYKEAYNAPLGTISLNGLYLNAVWHHKNSLKSSWEAGYTNLGGVNYKKSLTAEDEAPNYARIDMFDISYIRNLPISGDVGVIYVRLGFASPSVSGTVGEKHYAENGVALGFGIEYSKYLFDFRSYFMDIGEDYTATGGEKHSFYGGSTVLSLGQKF